MKVSATVYSDTVIQSGHLTQNWNGVQTLDMIGCIWPRFQAIIKTLNVETWAIFVPQHPCHCLNSTRFGSEPSAIWGIQLVALLSMPTGCYNKLTHSQSFTNSKAALAQSYLCTQLCPCTCTVTGKSSLNASAGRPVPHCMSADFCLLIWYSPSEVA